jgi:hypothetical protein
MDAFQKRIHEMQGGGELNRSALLRDADVTKGMRPELAKAPIGRNTPITMAVYPNRD